MNWKHWILTNLNLLMFLHFYQVFNQIKTEFQNHRINLYLRLLIQYHDFVSDSSIRIINPIKINGDVNKIKIYRGWIDLKKFVNTESTLFAMIIMPWTLEIIENQT